MRWGETVTHDFVKLYAKHQCLWNTNHPHYKVKHERDKAYASISAEFKACSKISLSIQDVKVKIKNLRSTYMQEVNKVLQKSTPDRIYQPSLVWFDDMDQCLKHGSNMRRLSNVQQTPEVDSSQIWVNQIETNMKEESDPDPLTAKSEYCLSPKQEESYLDDSEPSTPPKKIKKKKYKHTKTLNIEPSIETTDKEDEFDIFGKYIASQLRSMHLNRALRLQLEIHGLVNEARVSDMND